MLFDDIKESLSIIREKELYPKVRVVNGISSDPEIIVEGKKVLLFCSGNYLGLANNDEIKKSIINGLEKYGIHPAGSRLISGTLDIHVKLEKKIAEFKNTESAMVFTSGTMANMGVIPALINLPNLSVYATIKKVFKRNDAAVFSDELNHATIVDGCRLANAKRTIYTHNDMNDLEKKLRSSKEERKLIVTDGVFSMDGDIAPLPKIVNLAKKYGANIMVDDAHATGVLGKNGKGTVEHFGITSGIDIHMGTFSKAFGVMGGFIAGDQEIIDYLRIFARTYMFTGSSFGSLAMGIMKSFEIIENESERRKQLWWNTEYFRSNLHKMGYNTLNSQTPIIPIFVGDETKSIEMADELFENGIFAPCVRWPSVAKKESRIRFSLMTTHTKDNLDYALNILEDLGKKYKVN
ncbi:aminotransferase class I/II-fold pyridoxal phosphate-dependent enzyme [Patescibacteria group bacterium]|nr:aminotransferase class I/II-fold pyridoxal phosphate-dependent enzyme [Patescibacteria group bacterium]MBU1074709.1 aminotransferase class I/II-fold pyridoxal phosphate-dependent enzyme [Patescibacteria group bacterium]MBU1952281.1 aminotransferase class I/II-fold pyridoxal phosphate-dependent enzyme [Patescibacteria group bacterium]